MQEAAEKESSVKGRRRSADLDHADFARIPMPSPPKWNEGTRLRSSGGRWEGLIEDFVHTTPTFSPVRKCGREQV